MLRNPPRKIFDRYNQGHRWYSWNADDAGTLTFKLFNHKTSKNAGQMYSCAHCRYALLCLRQHYPNVCCHCRATITQHLIPFVPKDVYPRLEFEREYVCLQPESLRVSSACPLFIEGSRVCIVCRETEASSLNTLKII